MLLLTSCQFTKCTNKCARPNRATAADWPPFADRIGECTKGSPRQAHLSRKSPPNIGMSWHSRDLAALEKINKSIIKLNHIRSHLEHTEQGCLQKESCVKRITSIPAGEGVQTAIYGGESFHATKKQGYVPSSHPAAHIP